MTMRWQAIFCRGQPSLNGPQIFPITESRARNFPILAFVLTRVPNAQTINGTKRKDEQ
jgi:hypothetical protein